MKTKIEQVWPGWYAIHKKIGKGPFGIVYEVHRGEPVTIEKAALKVITLPYDISENEVKEYHDLTKAYSLMDEVKCPNVIFFNDWKYVKHDDGNGWDIFIKMPLLAPMRRVFSYNFNEKKTISLGMDICKALIFCQRNNIVHGDIKPQNIFIFEDGTFKLGDFGIARIMRSIVGDPKGVKLYMAPEVYNNEAYSSAADQYSLGLILYGLLNGRAPFLPAMGKIYSAKEGQEALERRLAGEPFDEPVNGSDELKAVVMKACQYLPENRFSSPEEFYEALEKALNRLETRN